MKEIQSVLQSVLIGTNIITNLYHDLTYGVERHFGLIYYMWVKD